MDYSRNIIRVWSLLFVLRHRFIGSPLKPGLQTHIALWLITWQWELGAHNPEQGSVHR